MEGRTDVAERALSRSPKTAYGYIHLFYIGIGIGLGGLESLSDKSGIEKESSSRVAEMRL